MRGKAIDSLPGTADLECREVGEKAKLTSACPVLDIDREAASKRQFLKLYADRYREDEQNGRPRVPS
jgi:hypothetical protein